MSTRGHLIGGGYAVYIREDMYPWVYGIDFAKAIEANKGVVDKKLLEDFSYEKVTSDRVNIRRDDATYIWNNSTKKMTVMVMGRKIFSGSIRQIKNWVASGAEPRTNPNLPRKRNRKKDRGIRLGTIALVSGIIGIIYLVYKKGG